MKIMIASGKVRIDVIIKLCQKVLDEKEISKIWNTSLIVPIYKGKRDMTNCRAYRGVKLLEHRMKIVEKIFENMIRALVVDDIQFGFIPGRGTTDALFIVRRMQEEYKEKDKILYTCFVNLEKIFDRVPRRAMQWGMRKNSLSDTLVKAVMSLYEVLKTKVKVGWEFSEEFYVAVGVHQGSVL